MGLDNSSLSLVTSSETVRQTDRQTVPVESMLVTRQSSTISSLASDCMNYQFLIAALASLCSAVQCKVTVEYITDN